MKKTIKTFFILIIPFIFFSCKNENKTKAVVEKGAVLENIIEKPKHVIDIITRSMEFQTADTIPFGWNTFKYDNRANETHFFRFIKLTDNITIDDYKKEVDPVFEEGMDLINEGKPDEGFKAFAKLPEWFGKCVPFGGSGLISPKKETLTSLFLQPGNYLIECYIKMPNGKFHSTMGMIKQIYVSNSKSNIEPPKATDTIDINKDGFNFKKPIKKGKHVFQINVEKQQLHENFATSDLHLVKLDATVNLDSLESWMVWYNPKGFITPVPNGTTFLGGFNDAVEGSKGYFYADLKPDKYMPLLQKFQMPEKRGY